MADKNQGGNGGLPLFEYAKRFEDFGTFEDEEEYFIHCVNTCGFSKKDLAYAMKLSPSALSARLSPTPYENGARFSLKERHLYIEFTRDPRPAAYVSWFTKRVSQTEEESVREAIEQIRPLVNHLRRIADFLDKKK